MSGGKAGGAAKPLASIKNLNTCPEPVRLGTEQHCVMERIDGGERALAVALPAGDGSVLQPQALA